jgi:hypothetical protein
MPAASTHTLSVQVLGFEDSGLLTRRVRLYAVSVRQASALPAASFRFHLAMITLAVRLALAPVGCAENFPLQVSAPCRAHHKKSHRAFHPVAYRDCKSTIPVLVNFFYS